MIEMAILAGLYLLVFIFDLRPKIKKQEKKVVFYYCFCFAISLVIVGCYLFNLNIYSPTKLINDLGNALKLAR